MIDHLANNFLKSKFEYIISYLPKNCSANMLTITGFLIGIFAVLFISNENYILGLFLIIFNRFFDGLDGAVARKNGSTNFGGYLDIICDFIFYSAVVIGFAIADLEKNGLTVIFLLFSFVGTGTSFLAFAAIEKKNDIFKCEKGQKGFYYMKGLIEGSETIAFYIMICIFPDYFSILGIIFGFLCWITVLGRIFSAYTLLDRK